MYIQTLISNQLYTDKIHNAYYYKILTPVEDVSCFPLLPSCMYCAPWPLWPLKPLTARAGDCGLSWAVEPVSWPCAAVTGAALSCACDKGGSSVLSG